eukprot:790189-Pleurochrysis_carterae.AAC.1
MHGCALCASSAPQPPVPHTTQYITLTASARGDAGALKSHAEELLPGAAALAAVCATLVNTMCRFRFDSSCEAFCILALLSAAAAHTKGKLSGLKGLELRVELLAKFDLAPRTDLSGICTPSISSHMYRIYAVPACSDTPDQHLLPLIPLAS